MRGSRPPQSAIADSLRRRKKAIGIANPKPTRSMTLVKSNGRIKRPHPQQPQNSVVSESAARHSVREAAHVYADERAPLCLGQLLCAPFFRSIRTRD